MQERKPNMNKAQLIEVVAKAASVTKVDAENVLNAAIDSIKKSVKKGEDVTLIGFGTFTKSKRQARSGRNPQTGKEIEIPAMTVPKFRPGREFKDAIK
jgi:DNA-binding protein HU-beta